MCKDCTKVMVLITRIRVSLVLDGFLWQDTKTSKELQNHLSIWQQEWLKCWIQSSFLSNFCPHPALFIKPGMCFKERTISPLLWIKHLSIISQFNMCQSNEAWQLSTRQRSSSMEKKMFPILVTNLYHMIYRWKIRVTYDLCDLGTNQ